MANASTQTVWQLGEGVERASPNVPFHVRVALHTKQAADSSCVVAGAIAGDKPNGPANRALLPYSWSDHGH